MGVVFSKMEGTASAVLWHCVTKARSIFREQIALIHC